MNNLSIPELGGKNIFKIMTTTNYVLWQNHSIWNKTWETKLPFFSVFHSGIQPRYRKCAICFWALPGEFIHLTCSSCSITTALLKICSSSLPPLIRKASAFSFRFHSDNTAGIRTERSGFNRHEQNVYFLPILVVDSGPPSLSSTGTLTIYVCGCDTGERLLQTPHHYITLPSLSPCGSSWKGHLCRCCAQPAIMVTSHVEKVHDLGKKKTKTTCFSLCLAGLADVEDVV